MPTWTAGPFPIGQRVYLRPPRRTDAERFIAAASASARLHAAWVRAPRTSRGFGALVDRYAQRCVSPKHAGFLVLRKSDDALVGVYNFSEIVRGGFQSAYLGYYAFAPHAGNGLMSEGLALALDAAFGVLKLHRVEVNIQPTNERSLALVQRLGFAREGFSRRYVKVGGRWRDHVRYAMLAEDWRVHRGPFYRQLRAARR
ncbi:MAG TPA: GNAT family protein [Casimicrobiaceae bacterium]|nr:GNAT family protein [Casimicrobiaceae bacterium]